VPMYRAQRRFHEFLYFYSLLNPLQTLLYGRRPPHGGRGTPVHAA
jgi:hypothetical protein